LEITETKVNIISENTNLSGTIYFDSITRIHGMITGNISTSNTSSLIISETGKVKGNIDGSSIIIDGFVEGNIKAEKEVLISSTGRVVGNIHTASLKIEFGAYFDGDSLMGTIEQSAG